MRLSSAVRRSSKSTRADAATAEHHRATRAGKRATVPTAASTRMSSRAAIPAWDSVTRLQGALTVTSSQMREKQGEQRAERNHDRSEEAHWQGGGGGAAEEETPTGG